MSFFGPKDFIFEVAKGNVPGHSILNKFGYNPSFGTTEVDVWTGGGTYVFPSDTGTAVQLVGGVGDTNTIVIEGLDENFDSKIVSVALTGTTPVLLAGLFARVFRAFVNDSAEITDTAQITDQATGLVVFAEILVSDQQTNMLIWTVPAGHTAFIKLLAATYNKTGGATNSVVLRVKIRTIGGVFRNVVRFGLQSTGDSELTTENITPEQLPGKTDVIVTALATAADSDVSSFLSFVVIEDEYINLA
jgi:hypothetical protein